MRNSLTLASAVFLVSADVALAQEADTTLMDPIVVTATTVEVPATTVATTVITGEELRSRGISRVVDALQQVAGLTLVQSGSRGGLASVYLRGGEQGYTQVLLDGVPLNQPGGDFDFAHLLAEDVERIEIARGPSSVLYGSDAVSGVIQIFTRRGVRGDRASLSLRGGSFGTYTAAANLMGSDGDLEYGLSLGQYFTKGIYEFNNEYRNTYLNGSVHLRPDAVSDLRLNVRYSDDRYGTPTDGTGNVVDRNAFSFGERLALGVDAGRYLSERLEARVSVSSYATDNGFDDGPDGPADTLGFFGFRSLNDITRRSGEVRINGYTGVGIITAGAHLEQERERSFSESQSEFGPSASSFERTRWNRAGFMQVAGGLGDARWQIGARLDDNDAFGTFFTYRLGASYDLPSRTRVRVAVGNAFREPTFFQNFAEGFTRGNPDLDPERSQSWEIGVRQEVDIFWIEGTWFNQRFRDLIEFTFSPPQPTDPNFFNIAEASADGLELQAGVRTDFGARAELSYTLVDTEVAEGGFDTSAFGLFVAGDALLRRPRHQVAASVGYGSSRWSGSLTGNWVGERDDIDFAAGERVVLDSHLTIDLGASVVLFDGARTLTLETRLQNILDEEFEAVAGFPSPGRSVLTGVRLGL